MPRMEGEMIAPVDEAASPAIERVPQSAGPSEIGPGGPPASALLRVRDAASFLGLTEKSLRHRIGRGQVPAIRLGASVFLRRTDLLRLVAEGRGLSSTGSR
jgi:hypothetical protein